MAGSYGAIAVALGVGLSVCLPASAQAETQAGTPIVNTAALRYDRDGASQSITSNTVTLTVAERLDVRLVREGQGAVVVTRSTTQPSAQPTIVRLTLTNADNGSESFALDASLSAPTITFRGLAIDGDGDGRYGPATDTALVDGRTPVLAPGQSITLFALLLATADTGTTSGAGLTVTARAVTGSGAPGVGYEGKGDSGSDAVVGPTGAIASVVVPLTTGLVGPALVKSQSVRAADGSQNAVRDAVITYTLEARFTDTVTGARIADPIPEGTVFVPGSLTLDGAPLSDAADGDAGRFDAAGAQPGGPSGAQSGAPGAGGIAVTLGQVAAASVHTVQFKAKIQ